MDWEGLILFFGLQLNKTYEERGSLIEVCLNESQARLQELRKVAANKRDDPIALKNLRSEQSKVSIANLWECTLKGHYAFASVLVCMSKNKVSASYELIFTIFCG